MSLELKLFRFFGRQQYKNFAAVLGAVSADSTESLIKILMCYVKLWKGGNLTAAVFSQIPNWATASREFIKSFNISVMDFNRLTAAIAKGDVKSELVRESALAIAYAIRDKTKNIQADTSIHPTRFKLLNYVRISIMKEDTPSWNLAQKDSPLLNDNSITEMFSMPVGVDSTNISSLLNEMKSLVKKIWNKEDIWASATEGKEAFNSSNPTIVANYEKYKAVRAQVKKIFDAQLQNILRSNSGLQPLEKVKDILRARGFNFNMFPSGFTGQIGLYNGKPTFAINGEFIDGGIPAPNSKIIMNPNYNIDIDGKAWVYKIDNPGFKNITMQYTVDFKKSSREGKFEVVNDAILNIDSFLNKWKRDIHQDHDPRKKLAALMTYLIYRTGARIGAPGNKDEKGNQTYGLSTLLLKHVKFNKSGDRLTSCVLNYSGKKGINQYHLYSAAKYPERFPGYLSMTEGSVILETLRFIEEDSENDPKNTKKYFFQIGGRRITEEEVRRYMKSIGMNITPHKLRHVQGTIIANDILNRRHFRMDSKSKMSRQRQAEEWFKKNVAEDVAKQLGHKNASGHPIWTTSVQNYISPETSASFFKKLGLHVPVWIEKLL